MSKRFIVTIVTLLVIAVSAGAVIFLAKGYSISTKEKRIVGSGILAITSEPDAASVYLDGHLTTATNANISSLSPKTYQVKVIKEGFIPWERPVTVKEGLVTDLKITLFPSLPTIYPLTYSGVANPVLSHDGSKLTFIVPKGKKAGVWVWTMSKNQPIAFARSAEPHQITTNSTTDFSKAFLRWSADSKQVLATVGESNFLLDSDRLNTEPRDITPILQPTIKTWEDDTHAKDEARILTIKDFNLRKIASDSALVRWSPDETKFMVASINPKDSTEEAKLNFKTYDLEEKSPVDSSGKKDYELPLARAHLWLPDSRHIILVEDSTISVVDFDGTNKAIIYAGKFEDSFVFPWPDSSRLVFISSFPTPTASEPNFYGINLR